jgi:hypothetical protein
MLFYYNGSVLFLLWHNFEEKTEMTTLLREFEERLKQDREMHLEAHIKKGFEILEELKVKYKTEKWTMPKEELRWLAFQHEYNALKEKYGQTTTST